ncbi:hypothetical protein G6W61_28015 [Streptomyces sp. KAI-26]|uniref:DUF6907 domain-containing protein n=1 Tax=Streptomyces sp. KAI-26 TaxID=1169747 RepID=UPI0015872D1E|nr:hypothetical protein [Streptomyces sp. KAI-26]NUV90010.1 hypothetical protein [Streptomyces sp. KAI-26]NUW24024.1 hypothetical protein [Streptomyces roseoviolaceus]
MRNTARTTSIPATFRQSGAPVTPPAAPDPLETALRSAFDQGEPVDADGNPTVEPPPASPTATADLHAIWQNMTIGEAANTPLPQLLTLLGVTVTEVDPDDLPISVTASFHGRIGEAEIQLSRSLPQEEREPIVRNFLTSISAEDTHRTNEPYRSRLTRQITGTIECYAWCVEPHHEHTGNIENIVHQSSRITLELPTANGPMALLYAHIGVDPFGVTEVERNPHIVIDDEQSLHLLPLMQSVEFADEMFEFAAALRSMAGKAAR